MGPGGAPRSDTVKTNRFLGVLEPAGAQKAISGWKVRFSPNSTHFHENGWSSPKKCHFHDISPFWGKWGEKAPLHLNGYLLKLKNIARIGVLIPRAGKVRKCTPKSPFRAKAHFARQSRLWAKKCVLGPKGDFGWIGWNSNQFGQGIHRVSCILRILSFPWRKK